MGVLANRGFRQSLERVAERYDLDFADIYRSLLYYYDHADEMRQIRAEQQSVPDDLSVVRGPEDIEQSAQSEPEA